MRKAATDYKVAIYSIFPYFPFIIAIVIIIDHYHDSDKNTIAMVISMTIDDNPSAADGELTWCHLTCPKSTTSR